MLPSVADDVAASDDHRVRTVHLDVRTFENLDDTCRRAWGENVLALPQSSDVHRMESVDIFFGRDRSEDLAFIDVFRKRKLDQNAIDVISLVQGRDQSQKLVFLDRVGQVMVLGIMPSSPQDLILLPT